MVLHPGLITLFGSGETAPGTQKVYHALFSQLAEPPRVAILETPAGFEPNSDYVAGQIGAYLCKRLQNFRPTVALVPARQRGTPFSPDEPALLQPLYNANMLFMGPGSPTYAVRQLAGSLAWHVLRALHRLGTHLVFSSAMVLASSRSTLPIYEIYKVGEELHWKPGLDLFGDFGLSLVLVSHWNNGDGGELLDTSRCYLGQARFGQLLALLPDDPERRVVGIDENTALTLDLAAGTCVVRGAGAVSVMHAGTVARFEAGSQFDLHLLGSVQLPAATAGIPEAVWEQVMAAQVQAHTARTTLLAPDAAALVLLQERTAARERRDWSEADRLRRQLETLGWRVQDTPQGPQLEALG
jgi:hypothetical protein